MLHQHVFTIVNLKTTSRLSILLILVLLNALTIVTCVQQQQIAVKQTVQSKFQNVFLTILKTQFKNYNDLFCVRGNPPYFIRF